MKANLISTTETEKDEIWIEKYRAAHAALGAEPPLPRGFRKLLAAALAAGNKIREVASRRVRSQTLEPVNGRQNLVPIDNYATPTVADIVEEGMKRVEILRRQSQKKATPTKSARKNSSNKSIA